MANNGPEIVSSSQPKSGSGRISGKAGMAADALLFFIPAPIKYTVLPAAQIVGGFTLDYLQKRKAVNIVLKANPTLSRTDARKVALGGIDAVKLLASRLDRPVSQYSVSEVIDTMVQDGTVSSRSPLSNTFEFVSDASKSVLKLFKEQPDKSALSDQIPASLTKAPNLTFGVIESKDVFPSCVNMKGKVFNISMNEDTYYKICRRFRMSIGAVLFILFCIVIYFTLKVVIGFLNSRMKTKEELVYYNNPKFESGPEDPRGRPILPPRQQR